MERRKINVEKSTLRNDLELFVGAWNAPLKGVVKSMDNIILLRNAHPFNRSEFAYKLRDAGMITEFECKEFTKLAVR